MTPPMQILIVDDDAQTRLLLARLLGDEGHEVDACANGAEALVRLCSKTYAAMLTDLVMPGMSGLELVREARATCPGLNCMIITGQRRPREADRGGVPWFSKPLDFDALLACIAAG